VQGTSIKALYKSASFTFFITKKTVQRRFSTGHLGKGNSEEMVVCHRSSPMTPMMMMMGWLLLLSIGYL